MGTWAKSRAEMAVARELAIRGVRVVRTERRGTDLDVHGVVGDLLVRVAVLGASGAPGGLAFPAADPCFVRIELGERRTDAARWGAWQELVWGTSRTPFLDPVTIQVVAGVDWLVVAAGFVPDLEGSIGRPAVELAFATASRLWPEGGPPLALASLGTLEPDLTFGTWGQSGDEARRARRAGAAIVLAGAMLGCVGLALAGLPGVGVTVGLGGAVAASSLLSRLGRADGEEAGARRSTTLLGLLSGAQPFDSSHAVTSSEAGIALPVLIEGSVGRELTSAVVHRTEATAQALEHGMTLRVGSSTLAWPSGTLELCRVLPAGWLAAEVTGREEDVALAPGFRRTSREPGRVRWLLTADEVEAGALDDLLQGLAGALRSARGAPYRD